VSAVNLDDAKLTAAIDFIGRTQGARQVQIRYSDDEQPVVWFVVALYDGGGWEADAAPEPVRAALRLCERLADGGRCTHCGRPTGLDPDTLETMPLNELICWYQMDPGTKRFTRGCA